MRKEGVICQTGKIEVMDNVFIGAGAMIMSNVRIGPNAIVAAGSVATGDAPEGAVAGGNPARVIGGYQQIAQRRKLQR